MSASDWAWLVACVLFSGVGGWMIGWLIAVLQDENGPNNLAVGMKRVSAE